MALSVVGCSPTSDLNESSSSTSVVPSTTSPTTTTTKKDDVAVDYSALLLTAEDLSDAEDTFAARSSTPNPSGLPGASALFVNSDDTRALSATFAIYPDPATATATLRQALTTVDSVVVGGTQQPSRVGTDGTLIRGEAPDGGKAVTLLFFTQGPALVRLEFQSAIGDVTTDEFVTSIGKMQQIALRVGLADRS